MVVSLLLGGTQHKTQPADDTDLMIWGTVAFYKFRSFPFVSSPHTLVPALFSVYYSNY